MKTMILNEEFFSTIERLNPLVKFLVFLGVILVGWLVSSGIGQAVKRFLDRLRINSILKRMGWTEAFLRVGISLNVSKFFGEIVKWTFALLFLMLAFELIGLPQFSGFLGKILEYLPNIYISMLIFLIAVYLVDFSYKVILVSTEKSKIKYSKIIGGGIRGTIWLFAILAIFLQLGIATEIIKAILYGVVAILALSLGLSLGLGGRDLAKEFLEEIKQKFS